MVEDKSKKVYAALAAVLVLVVAVNLNALGNDSFFGDDYSYIVKNPSVRSLANIPAFFHDLSLNSIVVDNWVCYRPLTMISYALNYHFGGADPLGYHVVNLAIHVASTLLVFLLVAAVTGRKWIALATATLFGAHPLASEVLNYINTRSSSLSVMFYLLSFYLYVVRVRPRTTAKRSAVLAASLVAFVLALLSKELPVTLPLVIVLYDLVYRRERLMEGPRGAIATYAVYFGIAVGFVFFRKVLFASQDIAGLENKPYDNIIFPAQILLYQMKLLFFPKGLTLYYFDFNPVRELNLRTAAAVAFGVAMLVVPLATRRRDAIFFTYWILVTGIPTILIDLKPIYSLILDHRLYILAVGSSYIIAIVLAGAAAFVAKRLRSGRGDVFAAVAVFVVVALFSAACHGRNTVWKDGETLGLDMVSKYPESSLAHFHLGQGYQRTGQFDKALAAYMETLKLAPENHQARINLAGILIQNGRFDHARHYYVTVLENDPTYHNAHFGLGYINYRQGRYNRAAERFSAGIELFEGNKEAYIYIGDSYERLGMEEKARNAYLSGLEVFPESERLHERLQALGEPVNMWD